MKDVAGMLAEKYGATADEIVAAGAMKLYLQSMEPAEALRKVRAVYEPKVIMLDSEMVMEKLKAVDGKCLIKCASVEFMSFIEDVYRSLRRREY